MHSLGYTARKGLLHANIRGYVFDAKDYGVILTPPPKPLHPKMTSVLSVTTGAQKDEPDGGNFAFVKDSTLEQKVSKYSITFKDDLLLISQGQSMVVCFRAPHIISAMGSAGQGSVWDSDARTARCCNKGQIGSFNPGCETENMSAVICRRSFSCAHFT